MNRRFAGAIAATGLAATIATAPAAFAHDSVIKAQPGIEETVTEFPDELVLEFSGIPKDGFNTLALSRAVDDEVLFSGEPEVEGQTVRIDVPEGLEEQPGEYRIGFQITSSDGHATKGMTRFSYEPQGAESAEQANNTEGESNVGAEETSENSDEVTSRSYTWLWLLLGVLLFGGVGIAAMGKRQRTDTTDKRIRDLDYNSEKDGNQYDRAGHTGAGKTAAEVDEDIADPRGTSAGDWRDR